MKELTTTIPNTDFFIHISPAPPKEVNLFEIENDKEEFLVTDTATKQQIVAKRIDFITFRIDGSDPIPIFLIALALNTANRMKAVSMLRHRFPGVKEVAFFLFEIVEILEPEKTN